jgi:cellulose synthase/poly-beta-1,6-N-acetylglucosamine synthase-like glycosyltransferase/GGDEF domain-containing protein
MPDNREGLAALAALRSHNDGGAVAAIVLARKYDLTKLLGAFALGADDVVPRSIERRELAARIRARLDRRAVPRDGLVRDPVTNALNPEALQRAMGIEFERVRRSGRPASLAYLAFDEMPSIEAIHGQRARDELLAQIVALVEEDGRRVDLIGLSRGHLALILPETTSKGARIRLNRLVQKIHHREFAVDGRSMRLTPVVGYVTVDEKLDIPEAEERAWTALMHSATQLDLYPVEWRSAMSGGQERTDASLFRRTFERHRTAMQVIAQQVACIGLPVLAYWLLDGASLDVTGAVYLVVVVALAFTAVTIWIESLAAFRPETPPATPAYPYPRASAIIAAYLPNEAETIIDTVRAFLRQDYPDLQVILAYNTPHDLPVEAALHAIAARDPRLVPIRVRDSVSKAQNVNAALTVVTGEFVGVFDADHHPTRGAFRRAWRWISHGADVVQGHCVVRDGDGFLQRLIAAEFESIYAVAHPGRARLSGFGIFGGSNGFWRTSLLLRTRMRGFMLTEDIDSSMRVVAAGGRIVSDPGLVSTELSPPDWHGLWNQRLRWAQGWSQVSLRHLIVMLRNNRLTRRQRVGLAYLLGWRELYPWISLQAFPILCYWFLRGAPPIDWFVPVFIATTLFTTSAGVMQAWTSWKLARPHLHRRPRWFVAFGIASLLFYTEYKNAITRTAHLKEAMRERSWKVTPRAVVTASGPALPDGLAVESNAA